MKVLITGAGGYLGHGLIESFESKHALRLMDVVDFETPHEKFIGSVADLDTVRKAADGVDAMVISHMASRQAGAYDTPVAPFDVNVKGTANLFFAAVECDVEKAVLVSSSGSVGYHAKQGKFLSRDLPLGGRDMYSLTKVCQEMIAEHYHRVHERAIAVLRPGYVVYDDTRKNKYGEDVRVDWNWNLIDPRDIGEAAKLSLELPDLAYEIFYLCGQDKAADKADAAYARERLGWEPKFKFELPAS